MRYRIAVLGGSSPFTAALINAFVAAGQSIPRHDIVLYGRNIRNLHCVTRYAKYRTEIMGWRVSATTNIAEAIEGADIVIHQIRYGDLDGREQDERLALQFHIPPDETFAPGGVQSVLRTMPELRRVTDALMNFCPDAWVLNLTNPLSLVTTLMIEAGLKRCVGLCELPLVTARETAQVLDLPFAEVQWTYTGLNHRGFIVGFSHAGSDRIEELVQRLSTRTLAGATASEISELHAVPTKYFGLLSRGEHSQRGRAKYLSVLREQILEEMCRDPFGTPPSLRNRYLEWYPQSVVPMVAALESSEPTLQVVNALGADGIVEERQAWVSASSLELCPAPVVSTAVSSWIMRFRSHEKAMLRVVRNPCLDTIKKALSEDPLIPSYHVLPLAEAIWRNSQRYVSMCHPKSYAKS